MRLLLVVLLQVLLGILTVLNAPIRLAGTVWCAAPVYCYVFTGNCCCIVLFGKEENCITVTITVSKTQPIILLLCI